MKVFAGPVAALLFSGFLSGCIAHAPARIEIAIIDRFVGMVKVIPAGSEEWTDAVLKYPLGVGDRVLTGSDGWAFLLLQDGSRILIGQGADFLIESLDPSFVQLEIKSADLGAWIRKRRNRRMRLRTPSAAAIVRSKRTVFRVSVDEETGNSTWDVLEGEILLSDNFGNAVSVGAGERISSSRSSGLFGKSVVPTPIPTAGLDRFENPGWVSEAPLGLPPSFPDDAVLSEEVDGSGNERQSSAGGEAIDESDLEAPAPAMPMAEGQETKKADSQSVGNRASGLSPLLGDFDSLFNSLSW